MTWHAYVDESMRQRPDSTGIYVLAATILERSHIDETREAAGSLVTGSQRFHWRDEKPTSRLRAVSAIARLNAVHLVVIGTSLENKKQERARRKCLERLLWRLSNAQVSRVWLEARTKSLNAQDIALIDFRRVQGIVPDTLRADFVYPSKEPLAWLPDAVAGAVSAHYGDKDERYVMPIRAILEEHAVDLG